MSKINQYFIYGLSLPYEKELLGKVVDRFTVHVFESRNEKRIIVGKLFIGKTEPIIEPIAIPNIDIAEELEIKMSLLDALGIDKEFKDFNLYYIKNLK